MLTKILCCIVAFLIMPIIGEATNIQKYSQAFLDMQQNQVVLNNNGKNIRVTTLGNIRSTSSEKECLNYMHLNPRKTCISYQIVVPNYRNKFWIFLKTELGSQELLWKTVFKYDFSTQKITNIKSLLPPELQNANNFYMWYGSEAIGYTIWEYPTYTQPKEISPSVFDI